MQEWLSSQILFLSFFSIPKCFLLLVILVKHVHMQLGGLYACLIIALHVLYIYMCVCVLECTYVHVCAHYAVIVLPHGIFLCSVGASVPCICLFLLL